MSSSVHAATRVPLVVAGRSWLTIEYKRKLTGYVWWKQAIFDLTRRWLRFCDTKLHLPTIVHHDKKGDFTIDYCGNFTGKKLAVSAIEARQAELNGDGKDSQFHWVDLPLNGMTPIKSGRYGDAGVAGPGALTFDRANKVVTCPFNGSECNPDDTLKRSELTALAGQTTEVLKRARALNRSI